MSTRFDEHKEDPGKRYDKVCRERDRLSLMLEATRAIALATSFDDAARKIYDICKALIGATCGYVALLNEDGSRNEVLFLDDGGLPCCVDPDLPMPIRGLRAIAYQSGETVYDNDFMQSRWVDLMPAGHVRLDNVLFAPLIIDGKAVGVLGLANKADPFTIQDKETARIFSEIAALALQHGKAHSEIREKEVFQHRKMTEEAFRMSERIFAAAFQSAPILMSISSLEEGLYTEVNDAFVETTGYTRETAVGRTSVDIGFISPEDREALKTVLLANGRVRDREFSLTRADGSKMTCLYSGQLIDMGGRKQLFSIAVDITEQKRQEQAIRKNQAELEAHALKLEQMNTALNVLIDHRDEEKKKHENEIIDSFKKLVFPYLEMGMDGRSREEITLIFDIVKRNINEILFKGNEPIQVIQSDFTPLEAQVAGLIREGKSSKDIAEILQTSVRAVYFHRENIRKKLHLTRNKTNLKTFLQTIG